MRFGSRGQTGLLSVLVLATCLCRSFATRASRASSTGMGDTGEAFLILITGRGISSSVSVAAASAWVSPSVWSARGGLASTRATRLQHSMATPSMTEQAKKKNPFNFSWQQTMLRVRQMTGGVWSLGLSSLCYRVCVDQGPVGVFAVLRGGVGLQAGA